MKQDETVDIRGISEITTSSTARPWAAVPCVAFHAFHAFHAFLRVHCMSIMSPSCPWRRQAVQRIPIAEPVWWERRNCPGTKSTTQSTESNM